MQRAIGGLRNGEVGAGPVELDSIIALPAIDGVVAAGSDDGGIGGEVGAVDGEGDVGAGIEGVACAVEAVAGVEVDDDGAGAVEFEVGGQFGQRRAAQLQRGCRLAGGGGVVRGEGGLQVDALDRLQRALEVDGAAHRQKIGARAAIEQAAGAGVIGDRARGHHAVHQRVGRGVGDR